LAVVDIQGHHVNDWGRAGAFPAPTDLLDDIRFLNDIHHGLIVIADDNEADVRVRKQLLLRPRITRRR
jgi:hypothetical protein